VGPADEEWRKEDGVFVHSCQPAVSFKSGVWQPTPMIYMSSRMHLNADASFKRGDVLGDGLIFVAGLVLAEPEDFLVSGEFTPSRESLPLSITPSHLARCSLPGVSRMDFMCS
jgi:hypothetical protein